MQSVVRLRFPMFRAASLLPRSSVRLFCRYPFLGLVGSQKESRTHLWVSSSRKELGCQRLSSWLLFVAASRFFSLSISPNPQFLTRFWARGRDALNLHVGQIEVIDPVRVILGCMFLSMQESAPVSEACRPHEAIIRWTNWFQVVRFFLLVSWQCPGMDVHSDIGHRLVALKIVLFASGTHSKRAPYTSASLNVVGPKRQSTCSNVPPKGGDGPIPVWKPWFGLRTVCSVFPASC